MLKLSARRQARSIQVALASFTEGNEGDWFAGPLGEDRRLDGILLTRWGERLADGAQQMRIKTMFDPDWLLNPGKVFPLEERGAQ